MSFRSAVTWVAENELATLLTNTEKKKESSEVSGILRAFVLFGPKEVFDQPITVLRVLLNHGPESTSTTRALW